MAEPPPTKKTPDASAVPSAEHTVQGKDVVLVHGLTDDRKGLKVLRAREERIEAGEVRPLQEGKPITGDVVRLRPREGSPLVCDVETDLSVTATTASLQDRRSTTAGPAQVASDSYRKNWEAIYRNRRPNSPGSSELN